MPDAAEGREAAHGSRMIEIKVRLWTDQIADGKGNVVPKHAWDAGVVRIAKNDAHGIKPGAPIPFNGMADLPAKIEKLLLAQGIKLHLSGKQRKYMVAD